MAAAPDSAPLLQSLGDSLHKIYPTGVKKSLFSEAERFMLTFGLPPILGEYIDE